MLKLEQIQKSAAISGLEPGQVVRIVTTEPVGDNALTVYYKTADGTLRERMLFRTDEANLSLAESGRPWAFDAPGDAFKLAAEAYRINLAHLFDPMMAVHTSNVEPLPHQITAVYESMLPRQPLRYVLADDPGAGKTIMAGLFIRELLMRADAKRVLIVAPGSLVEQWQDEMFEKFGLSFTSANGAPGSPVVTKIGDTELQGFDEAKIKEALVSKGFPLTADPKQINWGMTLLILFVMLIYVTMVYGPIAAFLVEMFPTKIRYTSMSLPYHIGNGWFGGMLPLLATALVAASGDIYYGLWYPIVVALMTFVIGLVFLRDRKDIDLHADESAYR